MAEIIRIASGLAETADTIGGKALSLARIANCGMKVPPAIVIPCAMTFAYQTLPQATLAALKGEVAEGMAWIEKEMGRECLFSVRSGAPVSMPGMMDTVLNVGINYGNHVDFEKLLGVATAADSFERFLEMHGKTVYGLKVAKTNLSEMTTGSPKLNALAHMEPVDQVMEAVEAVFKSWNSERAIEYRKLNELTETMGTAVTIQAMVYGNMGDTSGAGVMFSRDPASGANQPIGEFLVNAQGEDVVAGTHTPKSIHEMTEMGGLWTSIHAKLLHALAVLEEEYKDAVDVEFTVEQGEVYILQCRKAKRTDKAAVVIATDLLRTGYIKVADLPKYLGKRQIFKATQTVIAKKGKAKLLGKGIPAGGGVGKGCTITTIEDAINCNIPFVLVREETLPDDIKAMAKAAAIVTKKGGATSHAAVVARAMNKPCVTGVTDLDIAELAEDFSVTLVVDGETGEVWEDDQETMKLAVGSEDAVVELAVEIAKSTGQGLTYCRALPGVPTIVPLGDVCGDVGLMNGLKLAISLGVDVTVNFNSVLPDLPEDDKEVWNLIGKATILRTENEARKALSDAKPLTVKLATTVEEMFSGNLVVVAKELDTVIGSGKFLDTLVEKLGKPNVFVQPKTPYEMILSAIQ